MITFETLKRSTRIILSIVFSLLLLQAGWLSHTKVLAASRHSSATVFAKVGLANESGEIDLGHLSVGAIATPDAGSFKTAFLHLAALSRYQAMAALQAGLGGAQPGGDLFLKHYLTHNYPFHAFW